MWSGSNLVVDLEVDGSWVAEAAPSEVSGSNSHEVRRRRIGILGGTFDPPHVGHLVVADQVRTRAALDEVWLVVANDPWQKSGRDVTPASVRLAMTKLAVGESPGLVVSDVELEAGGPSYTIDTLATLRARHREVDWCLVLGADAAAGLDTWERADELKVLVEKAQVELIVVDRPGAKGAPPPGWAVSSVEIPLLDVSSSQLRAWVNAGRSVRFLTPDAVIEMVGEHQLYE